MMMLILCVLALFLILNAEYRRIAIYIAIAIAISIAMFTAFSIAMVMALNFIMDSACNLVMDPNFLISLFQKTENHDEVFRVLKIFQDICQPH